MSAREVIARWLASGGVWERELGDADAILAALAKDGLAVLPVEPTRAMLRAEDFAIPTPEDEAADPAYAWGRASWRAMLAAAKEDSTDA